MNVLVTGGTGFLGAYVMAALETAGHAAFAYDVAPPSAEMLAVSLALAQRFRPGQIGDLARLFDVCRAEKIESIVHAADMVGLEPSLAQPRDLPDQHHGLVHVCEAARQWECKLVPISSNAAYHKGAPGQGVRRSR
jgi:nucleoside-diphosphate-sugar epimerase